MQNVLYRMKWVQKGQNRNLHGMLYSWFPETPFKITKVTEYITFFQKTTRVLILSIYHDSFENFNIVPSIHSFVFSQVWKVSHLVPKLQDGLAWKSLVYQVVYCRETNSLWQMTKKQSISLPLNLGFNTMQLSHAANKCFNTSQIHQLVKKHVKVANNYNEIVINCWFF